MACWSRVFSGSVAATSSCTGGFNQTEPDQFSTRPTILDEIPVQVGSIGEAIGYWAEMLRRRLACTATITATTNTTYVITLRRGTRTDQVTWQVSNQQGAYPLIVGYTTAADSDSAVQFQNFYHCLDWLVERLA